MRILGIQYYDIKVARTHTRAFCDAARSSETGRLWTETLRLLRQDREAAQQKAPTVIANAKNPQIEIH